MVSPSKHKTAGKGLPEFMHAFPNVVAQPPQGARNLAFGFAWRTAILIAAFYGGHLFLDYQRNKLYRFANQSRTYAEWRPNEPPRSNGALKRQSEEFKFS